MKKFIHAVGIIFENSNKEMLILKRHISSMEGNTWGLVGGKVDEGENKYQAAIREAREEVGVDINENELQFLKTYNWERSDVNIKFETFKCLINNILKINLDKDENTKFMWENPKEIYNRTDLMVGLYPILEDEYSLL